MERWKISCVVRNKGHLKNKGENALDIKGVSDKFQGRGGLSDVAQLCDERPFKCYIFS